MPDSLLQFSKKTALRITICENLLTFASENHYLFPRDNCFKAFLVVDCNHDSKRVVPVSEDVGNAGGVPETYWYAAFMRKHNTEKSSAEKLQSQGYDCYVASQQEWRIWRNGKRKKIDRVVIPSIVFIRCTEAERKVVVQEPYISRFMMDRAAEGNAKVAVIPHIQIERLKFMLGQSDVPIEFVNQVYKPGDKVRIVRGGLKGLEGEVIHADNGKSDFVVSVDFFGNAKLTVNTVDLEPVG